MATKKELEERIAELEAELAQARTQIETEVEERAQEIALFKTMVESSLDGIFTTDLQEPPRLTYANRVAHKLFGCDYETQEMVGQMGTNFWSEEDLPFFAETLLPRVMAGGWQGEVQQKRKDGAIFDASAVIFPLRDDEGQPVGLVASIRDVSERKETEEKLKTLEHIVDHSPAVFFLWRAAEGWPVEFVSNNVEQFGYTPEDFYTGRVPYASIVHSDDLERIAAEVTQYSQEEERTEFTQEYRIITKSGEVCWTDDRTWIRRDAAGNITHYQGIVLDVTAQKEGETERERLQQELIEAQKRAIQELSTPVIPIMDRIIVLPLVGSIDSMRARDITRVLLAGISQHRAKVVILDVTGVSIMDTGIVNHLNKTIQAARLKGARTIVTGISDAVAEAIVDLGIDWGDVETLSDLQTGLVTALSSLGLRLERRIKQVMMASQR